MNSNWNHFKFKDIVQFSPPIKLDNDTEYPFIEMENITPGKRYVTSTEFKKYSSSGSAKFKNNDVIFARITPCLENRKIAQVDLADSKYGFGSTEFFVFRAKPTMLDQSYLYYYSTSYYFVESAINSMVGASGRQRADKKYIENLDVYLPKLKEQQQIAAILSTHDDLIETNNQRIATLEQLARQIYKEWFVRMRFPDWEKTPFHHGMPEQWERKKLGEISSFISRGITPIYDENGESIVINQKCIRNGRLNLNPSQKQSKDIPDNKKIQPNDVLINSTGEGTLGRVAIVTKNYDNHTVDTHVTITRPNVDKIDPIYYGFTLLNYQSIFEFMAVGATGQTELGRKDIMNIEIELPIFQLQSRFASLAKPMLEQIDTLIDQNEILTKTRNLLLPRLISGKLTLKQASSSL